MTDREAFLKVIEAAPWDDDHPRLIYADWLDEHDEPEEADRQRKWLTSEKWLRKFVEDTYSPSYDALIAAAVGDHHKNRDEDDDYYGSSFEEWGDTKYLHFSGRDASGEIPPEFWDHVAIVTGRVPPVKATRFSCSC
jgi:uncharacterized protein (TIGR02996 family)